MLAAQISIAEKNSPAAKAKKTPLKLSVLLFLSFKCNNAKTAEETMTAARPKLTENTERSIPLNTVSSSTAAMMIPIRLLTFLPKVIIKSRVPF